MVFFREITLPQPIALAPFSVPFCAIPRGYGAIYFRVSVCLREYGYIYDTIMFLSKTSLPFRDLATAWEHELGPQVEMCQTPSRSAYAGLLASRRIFR